jgi:hypothetical protein
MKQYIADQLRESDYEQILDFLDANAEKGALGGVYRVEIPEELYTPLQLDHAECQPHYFAVNLELRQVAFELLIRSREKLRCNCIAYATPQQRDYIIHFADGMLERLNISL